MQTTSSFQLAVDSPVFQSFPILQSGLFKFGIQGPDPDPAGSKALDPGSQIQDPDFQDPGSRIRDPESWIQDSGSRIQDPGSMIQDLGSSTLDPGSWVHDPGSRILDHGLSARIRDPGSRILLGLQHGTNAH